MKLNHRLLITSGLLLAMSTVAMSTATYAWFTTTRQSQISLNNVTIQQDSNLEMRVVSYNGTAYTLAAKDWGIYSDLALTGKAVQDVSGDGVSFFKPNIASDGTNFTNVADVSGATSSSDKMYTYVHEIVLGFRSDKAYEVWLGSQTQLTENAVKKPGAAEDEVAQSWGLSQCARVAFFDLKSNQSGGFVSNGENKTLTGVFVGTDSEGDKGYNFITSTSATSTSVKTGTSFNTGYNDFTSLCEITPILSPIADKVTSSAVNSLKVCTLATAQDEDGNNIKFTNANGVEQDAYLGYIGVRIWVEGTDEDCSGDVRNGSFNTTLQFSSFMPAA
ncbi:MAG: hypothetical protein ACI311_03975 [Bacilli bacterium]